MVELFPWDRLTVRQCPTVRPRCLTVGLLRNNKTSYGRTASQSIRPIVFGLKNVLPHSRDRFRDNTMVINQNIIVILYHSFLYALFFFSNYFHSSLHYSHYTRKQKIHRSDQPGVGSFIIHHYIQSLNYMSKTTPHTCDDVPISIWSVSCTRLIWHVSMLMSDQFHRHCLIDAKM